MNFTVVAVNELAPLLSEIPEGVMPVPGMRWIKPGSFLMESHPNEVGRNSDETQHKVTLTKGFTWGRMR
jgi:formylglycine-generating enzyme required for sulfatase activity